MIRSCFNSVTLFFRRWYPERATMQAFGRAPELQAAKIQDVAARSAIHGKLVQKMLTKDPRQRISSTELAKELQQLWHRLQRSASGGHISQGKIIVRSISDRLRRKMFSTGRSDRQLGSEVQQARARSDRQLGSQVQQARARTTLKARSESYLLPRT